jgi:hypothetical protein
MGAVRQAGQLFSNCLTDCDYGWRSFCGNNVIYIAQVRGLHFCRQLKRDRLLRSWRVTEIKGPRNAKPTRAQPITITGIFAEAGFPYLPKSVLEFWYD